MTCSLVRDDCFAVAAFDREGLFAGEGVWRLQRQCGAGWGGEEGLFSGEGDEGVGPIEHDPTGAVSKSPISPPRPTKRVLWWCTDLMDIFGFEVEILVAGWLGVLGFAEKKPGMFRQQINAGKGCCLDLQGRCWGALDRCAA